MHANTVRIAINFKSVGIWRGYTGNISPELLSIANVIDSIKYEKNTYADYCWVATILGKFQFISYSELIVNAYFIKFYLGCGQIIYQNKKKQL